MTQKNENQTSVTDSNEQTGASGTWVALILCGVVALLIAVEMLRARG